MAVLQILSPSPPISLFLFTLFVLLGIHLVMSPGVFVRDFSSVTGCVKACAVTDGQDPPLPSSKEILGAMTPGTVLVCDMIFGIVATV